ncbi:phage Gp37/Gp68 family protein [Saccharothrix xinjiangensis]|uniref:Phage Gp37/Gp68 family protein n=1 Tax=Saccharothrix xinjiangensis TaxID=204798 RepID=A0ABV9XWS9_9PSEU
MATSSIAWLANPDGTRGQTWNPVTGCDWASRGCDNCYALRQAKRLKGMEQSLITLGRLIPAHAKYQTDGDPRTSGPGFGVAMHPHALTAPFGWPTKPQRVFVNSMSDLFHPQVSDEFIAQVFAVMALTPQHTYKILTKRPQRMPALLADVAWQELVNHELVALSVELRVPLAADLPNIVDAPLPNVWIGVSVEDQHQADRRVPDLLRTRARVLWVSAEPLLARLDLGLVDQDGLDIDALTGSTWQQGVGLTPDAVGSLDWVVVGGESGPGARPMHSAWARQLRDDCAKAGVPFFFKQLGSLLASELGFRGAGEEWHQLPDDLRIHQYPPAHAAARTSTR